LYNTVQSGLIPFIATDGIHYIPVSFGGTVVTGVNRIGYQNIQIIIDSRKDSIDELNDIINKMKEDFNSGYIDLIK